MLLRTTDPFRDLDRLTQQLLGTTNRPAVMPMDAWREGDRFVIEFDLPGVNTDSIDLDVERNVLTGRAGRVGRGRWQWGQVGRVRCSVHGGGPSVWAGEGTGDDGAQSAGGVAWFRRQSVASWWRRWGAES